MTSLQDRMNERDESPQKTAEDFTIQDLIDHAHRYPDQLGVKASSLPSYATALKKFATACGGDESSLAMPLLVDNWDDNLSCFNGNNSERSRINKWIPLLLVLLPREGGKESFGQALKRLLGERSMTHTSLAKQLGVSRSTVDAWVSGKYEGPQHHQTVQKLERVLKVPQNSLLRLINSRWIHEDYRRIPKEWWPKTLAYTLVKNKTIIVSLLPKGWQNFPEDKLRSHFEEAIKAFREGDHLNSWRKSQRDLIKKEYALSVDEWNEPLKQDWNKLKKYMMSPLSLDDDTNRKSSRTSTVNLKEKDLTYYFGYLSLPLNADPQLSGMEMRSEELSLALLAVPELARNFLSFRRDRTGAYNSFTMNFLAFSSYLVRPQTGYLWTNPHLMQRLPKSMQEDVEKAGGWQDYCKASHAEFARMRRLLSKRGNSEQTRKAFEPIMPILLHAQPRELVLDAIDVYAKDVLSKWTPKPGEIPTRRQALRWRNLLLLSMLIRWPLRRSHWHGMTYYPHKHGHLRRRTDNMLHLVIKYSEFKNSGSSMVFLEHAPKEVRLDYDRFGPFSEIIQLTEIYLKQYHPVLVGNMGGYLFPKMDGTRYSDDDEGLSNVIAGWSTLYISEHSNKPTRVMGVEPFRIHAFRHIVGTDSMKNGSSSEGSWLLMDDPKQVVDTYSLFLPEDGLDRAFSNTDLYRPRPLNLGGKK